MGYAVSNKYGLPGHNQLTIGLGWNENLSGTTNNIGFQMDIKTRYRINGSWICSLKVNGETLVRSRKTLRWPGNTCRTIYNIDKSFVYTGNKRITIEGAIEGMDYYDIHLGEGSMVRKTLSFKTTVDLESTNRPPNTPSLSCSNTYSNSSYICERTIDLSISNTSDPDGQTVTKGIYLQYMNNNGYWASAGDQNNCILYSNSSTNVSKDITGYPRGTRFRAWSINYDSYGKASGESNYIENIYRNNIPTSTGDMWPNGGVFKDNYTINWNQSYDIDKQDVTYNLWKSINGDDWQSILYHSVDRSYTENVLQYPEGTSIKYKVCGDDGLTYGQMSYSGTFIKNTKPTTPSMIFPNSGYYLGSVYITWNNSTDPDGKGINHYDVLINGLIVGQANYNYFTWNIPSNDSEGKEYNISIIAYDNNGEKSDKGYASGNFKKASRPTATTNIRPNVVYQNNSIDLYWDGSLSSGIDIKYAIDVNINNSGWKALDYNVRNPNYHHDIRHINRGYTIQYRIKCINSFGQESNYSYSIVYKRSQVPDRASVIVPFNNSTVYNISPRIAITVSADKNNYSQKVIINSNGITYSSDNNQSLFSMKDGVFVGDRTFIFMPNNFRLGLNRIDITVSNGITESEATTWYIDVKNENIDINSGDVINAYKINEVIGMNNTLVDSYGVGTKLNNIYRGTYVRKETFEEISKSIACISNKVDTYSNCSKDSKFNIGKTPMEISPESRIESYFVNDSITEIKQI